MATRTKIDVCNLALSKLGVGARVSTMNDATAHALSAYAAYDAVAEAMFEVCEWPFAERRATLTLVDSNTASFSYNGEVIYTSQLGPQRTDWLFRYAYPSWCAKLIELAPEGMTRMKTGIRHPYDVGTEKGLTKLVDVDTTGVIASVSIAEPETDEWPATGEVYRAFVVMANADDTIVSLPVEATVSYTTHSGNTPKQGSMSPQQVMNLSVSGIPNWVTKILFMEDHTAYYESGDPDLTDPTVTAVIASTGTTLSYSDVHEAAGPETIVPTNSTEAAVARFIYTDLPEADAIYTMDLSDNPEVWPGFFTQAFAAAMAVEMAPGMTGMKLEVRQNLRAEYRELLAQAMKNALKDPSPREVPEPNYIVGRF